jgi:predicted dehydrogenase
VAVRVGICGAGRVSRLHADGFVAAGAKVVAFADPVASSAEAMAAAYGARAFGDLGAMVTGGELDVACIATPHHLHVEQARSAIEAGLDVFMDKPLALDPEEGRELVALARARGRRLGVNHNLLFHPAVIGARRLLADGAIGRPISAAAWSAGWLDLAPHDFRLSREQTGGGAWTDAGPHLVYTLIDLLGPCTRVAAFPGSGPSRLGGEDSVAAIMAFESGAVASLRISYAFRSPGSDLPWPDGWRQGIEINGAKGAIRIVVSPEGSLERFEAGDERWTRVATGLRFADSFDGVIADFVRARADGRDGAGSPDEALGLLLLMRYAFAHSR